MSIEQGSIHSEPYEINVDYLKWTKETVEEFKQDTAKGKITSDSTFKVRLGCEDDDHTEANWFNDISDELLALLTSIQFKIVSLHVGFNPKIKQFINLKRHSTGSEKLDKLCEIIANASNVNSLSVFLREFDHNSDAILLSKWINYIFGFKNAFSKIKKLQLCFNVLIVENTPLFEQLYELIETHKQLNTLIIDDEIQINSITKFWIPLLKSIENNKSIQSLSIRPPVPDIYYCISDKFSDEIKGKSEAEKWVMMQHKKFDYELILKRIVNTLFKSQTITKFKIDFTSECFGSVDLTFGIDRIELLYSLVNNPNLSDLQVGPLCCKYINSQIHQLLYQSPLKVHSIHYTLTELFKKKHIDRLSLNVYQWSLSNKDTTNAIKNNKSLSYLSLTSLSLKMSEINQFVGNIFADNVYINYLKLMIYCKTDDISHNILLENITKTIQNNNDSLYNYSKFVYQNLVDQIRLEYAAKSIINDYLLYDSLDKLIVDISIIHNSQKQLDEVTKSEKTLKDIFQNFENNYIKNQSRKIQVNVTISCRGYMRPDIEFSIPTKPKETENAFGKKLIMKLLTGNAFC